jgi:hypothetical protein
MKLSEKYKNWLVTIFKVFIFFLISYAVGMGIYYKIASMLGPHMPGHVGGMIVNFKVSSFLGIFSGVSIFFYLLYMFDFSKTKIFQYGLGLFAVILLIIILYFFYILFY